MNAHVLKNYFLRAGASYRRSAEWQKDFADGSGHSRVLRSGRFGIGVLAAFILGPQVEVKTRHYSQKYGLSFSARLETDPIDLRYCEMRVGTEIKIAVAKVHLPHLKQMFDSEMGDKLGIGSPRSTPTVSIYFWGRRLSPGEHIVWRYIADGAVQADIVVAVHILLDQAFCIFH
jgi:hypothetical protein